MTRDSDITFLDYVEEHVKEHPNRRIFTWVDSKGKEQKTLNYDQLWNDSTAIAGMLLEKAQPGDRIMICYPFGLEFLAALIGCMRAGMIACSAYPPNPTRLKQELPQFRRKVEDSGAKFALTTKRYKQAMFIGRLQGFDFKFVTWIPTDNIKCKPKQLAEINQKLVPPASEDIAFVQYTVRYRNYYHDTLTGCRLVPHLTQFIFCTEREHRNTKRSHDLPSVFARERQDCI